MYWGNGMSGWGMALMAVSNLLFWGLVITAIVVVVRHFYRAERHDMSTPHGPKPQQLLAERFARGDIDEDEFKRRSDVLASASKGSPGW